MKTIRYALSLLCVAASSAAVSGEAPVADVPDVQALVPVAPAASPPTPASTGAELERLLRELQREEQELKKRLGDNEHEAALAHARSVARGRAYVRLVRAGLLPVGGGFDALVDHATRMERLYRGLRTDLQRERTLAVERRKLNEKLEANRARKAPLEVQQRLLADAQAAVMAEEERRQAFASAFSSSTGAAHTAVYGATVGPNDTGAAATGFAALKGRLPFPITGRSEIRSARRASSAGPGLELRVAPGTPVRAVFAGRVAFADTYSDYGSTVIIDHGSRYYTVSANLGSFEVKVGDEVSSGERIGTAGSGAAGALLYFEVRVGTETVDPAEWLGL